MLCPKCNKESKNEVFCGYCGYVFESDTDFENDSKNEDNEIDGTTDVFDDTQVTYLNEYEAEYTVKEKKHSDKNKKSKNTNKNTNIKKDKKLGKQKTIVMVCIGILLAAIVAVIGLFTNWFGICSDDNGKNENTKKSQTDKTDKNVKSDSEESSDAESTSGSQSDINSINPSENYPGDTTMPEAVSDSGDFSVETETAPDVDPSSQNSEFSGGKYSGIDTYTNEEGNKAAMTDSGVEVEITAENFEQLMAEYMALSQTDPEKAQELLDQIQIFFDNVETENFIPVQ